MFFHLLAMTKIMCKSETNKYSTLFSLFVRQMAHQRLCVYVPGTTMFVDVYCLNCQFNAMIYVKLPAPISLEVICRIHPVAVLRQHCCSALANLLCYVRYILSSKLPLAPSPAVHLQNWNRMNLLLNSPYT